MSREEIEELGDEMILKAVTPPNAPQLAYELFNFIHTNIKYCLIPTMESVLVDKDKLERMAERRGVDLVRYDQFVDLYIERFLKWQTQ